MTPIRVVAAVVIREGRVLVTRRPRGTHLEGLWEFPGGKVEPGESEEAALLRELREEIDVSARIGELFARIVHAYPEKTVELAFYRCEIAGPEPRPVEVEAVAWVGADDLDPASFPPADRRLLERLRRELT